MVVITDMVKNGDPKAKDVFVHTYRTLTSTLNDNVDVNDKNITALKVIEDKVAEL
jgi:hypothetical protein